MSYLVDPASRVPPLVPLENEGPDSKAAGASGRMWAPREGSGEDRRSEEQN